MTHATAPSPRSQTHLQACLDVVQEALRNNDFPAALRLADEAVGKGIEHPNLLVLAAHRKLEIGDPAQALALAMRARGLAPRQPDALNIAGLSLAKLGRLREALGQYEAALRIAPATAAVHFHKGQAHEELSELKPAQRHYERAAALRADYPEPLSRLAYLTAQRGDYAAARALAKRALALDPSQAAATLALAMVEIGEKNFDQSLNILEPLINDPAGAPVNRAFAESLSADALDGLDRVSEAFTAYNAANLALRAHHAAQFTNTGTEPALARTERLIDYFRAADADAWRGVKTPAAQHSCETHVFLVGFPRSGTTLLEQVLAAHPDIEALEERDTLIDATNDAIDTPQGLDRFAALGEAELERYRALYWRRAEEAGATLKHPVFVDKMPLNSVLLCLIAKLFPSAKILFAVRDPRDVVFSCFRRRFAMSAAMFELTTLEGAARFYDAVMALAEIYRRQLPLDILDLRHEDMLNDFDTETTRVCSFLNIGWREEMRGFATQMRIREIDTPSAAQVARGLSKDGAGQWRRYREQLAPVMPILAPWVAHFGYSQD